MKRLLLCLVLLTACSWQVLAQVNSEEVLINRILITLQRGDDSLYATLFPKFDELYKIAQNLQGTDDISSRRIANIRSNPKLLQQFDPQYNPDIITDFDNVKKKGKDSGLHWTDMLLMRYELEKAFLPKELVGFEKVVPIRMQGYIYVQDLLTRRAYIIAVRDIHSFNNKWYGGHVVNILEADNTDEYFEKLAKERKIEKQKLLEALYGNADAATPTAADSAAVVKKPAVARDDDDDDRAKATNDVVERKLYTGKFDNEISVELYIRSLKGACPDAACAWEAIYKFGDQDDYLKLDVSKTPDGKWQFTEEDVGVLEVTIAGDKMTGSWTSFKDKTEYDAVLTEKKEVKSRKLFMLDDIIENQGYANP